MSEAGSLGFTSWNRKSKLTLVTNLSSIGQTSSIEEKAFKYPRLWEALLTCIITLGESPKGLTGGITCLKVTCNDQVGIVQAPLAVLLTNVLTQSLTDASPFLFWTDFLYRLRLVPSIWSQTKRLETSLLTLSQRNNLYANFIIYEIGKYPMCSWICLCWIFRFIHLKYWFERCQFGHRWARKSLKYICLLVKLELSLADVCVVNHLTSDQHK